MTQTENKNEIRFLIRDISNYLGLKIAGCLLALILIPIQIYFCLIHYTNFSPLYITLLSAILPLIFEEVIKRGQKAPEQALLPMLQKKYRYSQASKRALSLCFLINTIMLLAWRYSYFTGNAKYASAEILATISLIAYVSARVLIWLIFLFLFNVFPTKVMK